MAGLQRSAVSFRRQGSSGLVWDDKLIAELNQAANQKEEEPAGAGGAGDSSSDNKATQEAVLGGGEVKEDTTRASPRTVGSIERSQSNGGGRGYRTGKVSPAIEPPSPKVSACGFCSAFGRPQDKGRRRPPKHAGKRTK